jgi:purine-nucleoside phosphorylase
MSVAAVSCICNMGAGISDRPLSHQEVLDASKTIGESFEGLAREFVRDLEV